MALPPICGGEHVREVGGHGRAEAPTTHRVATCALDPNALDSYSATLTGLLKSVVRWRKLVPHLGY
ncbi:MAG: hypothetical protein ACO3IT_03300 [Ilumatobacteraceae bacterium]